jgi:hypothetical protein
MRRLTRFAAAALLLGALATGAAAQPVLDATIPAKASEQLIADLARVDLDTFAGHALKHMSSSLSERLKNNFAAIKDLGQSQYSELVYSRDYGQTGKDIIYKIDYDKAFTYVRLLWHVDGGNWRLVHISYKTENNLPFPAGWEHIYPK